MTVTIYEQLQRALTAEGRLSAVVLSLTTPVLALTIYLIQPDYLKPLTNDFFGIMGLIVAGILTVAGWFWSIGSGISIARRP